MTNPIKVSDTYNYYVLKVIPILWTITVKRSKIERGNLSKKIHDSNTSVTAQKMKFSIKDFFIFCVQCASSACCRIIKVYHAAALWGHWIRKSTDFLIESQMYYPFLNDFMVLYTL